MNIKKDILLRIYAMFFLICLFAVLIFFQAIRIQTVRADYWLGKADSLSVRYRSIPATRGDVISANGRLLATTLPTFEIRMDTKAEGLSESVFNENVGLLAQKLSTYFNDYSATWYKNKLRKARRNGNRYLWIKGNVGYHTLKTMKTWPLWKMGQFSGGLIALEKTSRKTPFGSLAQRTIGYVRHNAESVGLEAAFDTQLKGIQGRCLMQRISGGTWIPVTEDNEIDPKNGLDVVTTIDVNVQDVVQTALHTAVEENAADWGCAAVMEVKTGKIKAIANIGKNKTGQYGELYNYVVGYKGEPGSTMKLMTLAALLEDGHITIADSVDLENGQWVFSRRKTIRDSEGRHEYRNVTVQKAFERSSNVGFTKLASKYYQNNPKKFLNRLKTLGIHQKCDIEIQGEPAPFFRNPGDDGWSKLSIPSISYGYEIEMTPLQVLAFYNAVANNGYWVKPHLVESITKHGKIITDYSQKTVPRSIMSSKTATDLKTCLEGVMVQGTGQRLQSKNYTAGGKTGTTRLAVPGYGYGHHYAASFCGYFPAEDPAYSIIVVIHKPTSGKYYGALVAGPVFKAAADMLYAQDLSMQYAYNDTLPGKTYFPPLIAGNKAALNALSEYVAQKPANHEEDWLTLKIDSANTSVSARLMQENVMPNVLKMGLDDALFVLENAGLKPTFTGVGLVQQQTPAPHTIYKKGDPVQLILKK